MPYHPSDWYIYLQYIDPWVRGHPSTEMFPPIVNLSTSSTFPLWKNQNRGLISAFPGHCQESQGVGMETSSRWAQKPPIIINTNVKTLNIFRGLVIFFSA